MTRILFVDDEPNVLAGLRRMLRGRRKEWDMFFAPSGHEALELMREQPFDVVVSDMRMPGMDGAELLTHVQEDWPDTVRLVLSGQSDKELTLRAVGPAHQYLTKPCDPDLLYETISTTLRVKQRLNGERVRQLVGKLGWLPSLPVTYVELVAEMNSPNASVDSASQIIARDVGMSAKVLQLINSSFFGLPVHVQSVEHAAALLGLNVLRPLVMSSAVFRQFEDEQLGGFSLHGLVDHSMCVALLARRVACLEESAPELVDNALLAGLMHDVGQLVLAKCLPSEYAEVREAVAAGADLCDTEFEAFGATHAEVGAHLLTLWGLPTGLVEAVCLHHEPAQANSPKFSALTAVHAAEAMVVGENEGVREDTGLDLDYLEAVGCRERSSLWRRCWDQPLAEECRVGA